MAERSPTCWSPRPPKSSTLAVLHYDADFDLIAEATGQRCRWVVPAGTVD
jgi:hypothetical protein